MMNEAVNIQKFITKTILFYSSSPSDNSAAKTLVISMAISKFVGQHSTRNVHAVVGQPTSLLPYRIV